MGQAVQPIGVPTWDHAGIICTGEVYREYVKLTFPQNAALDDPAALFNAALGGGTAARSTCEGDTIDAGAFKALVRTAVAFNLGKRTT